MEIDHRDQEFECLKVSYSFRYGDLRSLKQIGQTYRGIFGNTYRV